MNFLSCLHCIIMNMLIMVVRGFYFTPSDPVHYHQRDLDPAQSPGAHAQVRPPAVRVHLRLHGLPHLVRHVQQSIQGKYSVHLEGCVIPLGVRDFTQPRYYFFTRIL